MVRIDLPPLRDRPSDIPLLVNAFIQELSKVHDRNITSVDLEARKILQTPESELPEVPSCAWKRLQRTGEAVEEIIRVAAEQDVDLIAMATQGHEGVLDALRGSVTEQVVRRAPCPVLAVPANVTGDVR